MADCDVRLTLLLLPVWTWHVVLGVVPSDCRVRIGCFRDRFPRMMSHSEGRLYGAITPAHCIQRCRDNPHLYAGMQDANECFCDNVIGGAFYATDTCTTNARSCPSNSNLRCGAGMRNDVWLASGARTASYLGCFMDSSPTDLSEYQETLGSDATWQLCVTTCIRKGYPYAGIKGGTACSCGFEYNDDGGLGDGSNTNCVTPCPGDGSEPCGGTNVNRIYYTGKDNLWQSYEVRYFPHGESGPEADLWDNDDETCLSLDTTLSDPGFMVVSFDTDDYYKAKTPGITILVVAQGMFHRNALLVFTDDGTSPSATRQTYKTCPLHETLPDSGDKSTHVFKCYCPNDACDKVSLLFSRHSGASLTHICEIRSCHSI